MISFTVYGDPQTKGSAKAFRHRSSGKIIVRNDNAKCAAWASVIGWHARMAMSGPGRVTPTILAVPVRVVAEFRITRPRTTKLAAPRLDLDKLVRACLDALTGIVFVDDSLVVDVRATKRWADDGRPGVSLSVETETAIGAQP